jgi:transcription antitermination protein NusB
MLSRRLIRIKVFKILFSKTITGGDSLIQAEKELIDSCDKTVDLYCMLLRLPVALKKIAEEKMEQGMRKFHPTPQEANPNKKFINNRVISLIENELEFNKKCDKKGLTWVDSKDFLKEFYKNLVTKQYFIDYMESDSDTMEEDKKFIRKFFEEEIDDNDNLDVTIEEMSLYWRDDTGYVANMILNNLSEIVKLGRIKIPSTFIKEDDRDFARKLLTKSMVNYDEYAEIVAKYIPNWDIERLVATDLALIVMGIAEAVTFDSIPLKVTINEYVEISKFYSTPNSKVFVNGLLDKILQQMVKEEKVVKNGRGLVGGFGENK